MRLIDYNADLFEPRSTVITPWRPRALSHEQWPPDYRAVYAWRIQTLKMLRTNPGMLSSARKHYKAHPADFIQDWMDTYNPRKGRNKWMPFVFFKRQYEFVDYLEELRRDGQNGLVEKCRDIGATWICCAYTVWAWSFVDEVAIGWGSRKQELVDKIGDPDSIFEKIRLLIKRLPDVWIPEGFKPRDHATFMKLTNPSNGAVVAGESGDNIGRGGRKTFFVKDEAQPLDAKILTPYGWQTMGDMRVGSIVMGPKGWRIVYNVNEAGEHNVYRLTFSDGSFTTCSENHLWKVYNRVNKKTAVMPLSQIVKKYKYYHKKSGNTQYTYSIPTAEPVVFDMVRDEHPLHPYLVGCLLGDGSVGDVPSHSPKITTIDQEIVQSFLDLMPDGWVIAQEHDRITYRLGDVRGRMGWKHKSRARLGVVASGIAGMKAETKRVPYRYKFASIEDRWAVLQGLMDTDGSAANGGYPTFHTASPALAADVLEIVQSLGGVGSVAVKPDHRGFKDHYIVYIRVKEPTKLFRLSRKIAQVKTRTKRLDRSIVNIEHLGVQPVRCITIDSPDGLYLTDNYIVTHNSAHYERPEKIEAALGDNTDVQIDISSVNGLGNVFHRRREGGTVWTPGAQIEPGQVRVFIFDWRDHPEKTREWYDQRKARAEREGMQHVFAQEVDRNYSAAVQNTIISYEWLTACVDAHLNVPYLRVPPPDMWTAGLDVADEGADRNALAIRQWIILRGAAEWGERDPGVVTRRTITTLRERGLNGIDVEYDSIGVGASVKAEYNRLCDEGALSRTEFNFKPWNAGAGVVNPFHRIIPDDDQSALNKDFFGNMKAQAWWSMRTRVYKTWRAVKFGDVYPADDLVSFDSDMPLLMQLLKELAQPTEGKSSGLRMIIEKKPNGTRSPNLADACIMAYFPAPEPGSSAVIGGYSG